MTHNTRHNAWVMENKVVFYNLFGNKWQTWPFLSCWNFFNFLVDCVISIHSLFLARSCVHRFVDQFIAHIAFVPIIQRSSPGERVRKLMSDTFQHGHKLSAHEITFSPRMTGNNTIAPLAYAANGYVRSMKQSFRVPLLTFRPNDVSVHSFRASAPTPPS